MEDEGIKTMNKCVKNILSFAGICLLILLCCSPLAYAVDGSRQTPYNGHICEVSGAHKQVCSNCHIPHGGNGIRIWARAEIKDKKEETKTLCASCHYAGNKDFPDIQSGLRTKETGQWCEGEANEKDKNNINGNVFLDASRSLSHVMGANFKPNIDSDPKLGYKDFLSQKGKAEVVGFPFSKTEGFYCGSCHNPHKQPNTDESGNGDYLRLMDGAKGAGTTHNRKEFCRQCHPRRGTKTNPSINNGQAVSVHASEPEDPQCEACHRPHDGYPTTDPTAAASIFINEYTPEIFTFPPKRTRYSNGTTSTPLLSSTKPYESSKCPGCHMSTKWPNAPQLSRTHAHHPIGHSWEETSCSQCHNGPKIQGDDGTVTVIQLDGFDDQGKPLSLNNQMFSCTSCHGAHTTDIEGNPSFLRYASFKNDDTALCEYCHNDPKNHPKSRALLESNKGKHFKTRNDPENHVERVFKATEVRSEDKEKCGGCMFCHFIHQNDDDPRVIPSVSPYRADIKSLMRVPARKLDWGSQGEIVLRSDPYDRYEALCYGCHGDDKIVGKSEKGSLLDPTAHLSHRFACKIGKTPTGITDVNILNNVGGAGKFPLGDGMPGAGPGKEGVMDDYGTVDRQFYCGSCHDVHVNAKEPYLFRLKIAGTNTYESKSPYEADGFCEQCHCSADNPDPMALGATHPVGDDKVPALPKTDTEFPALFAGGKSGSPLGITAGSNTAKDGVICLTCHNVHAAATSWNGTTIKDTAVPATGKGAHGQLLVMDNYSAAPGSNMCKACHKDF